MTALCGRSASPLRCDSVGQGLDGALWGVPGGSAALELSVGESRLGHPPGPLLAL